MLILINLVSLLGIVACSRLWLYPCPKEARIGRAAIAVLMVCAYVGSLFLLGAD